MLAVDFLKHDDVTMTLLGIAVIVLFARLAGRLFERLGQPPVVGEVIAGVLLGPTILGSHSATLFPLEARPMLKIVSTIGLVVFMFVIGLDLDSTHLGRDRQRVAGAVALSGTFIPFALGTVAALALYGRYQNGTGLLPFALFMGAAMSITAFPVLARILVERDLYTKPLGVVTMACAAGDDVLTWASLALVVSIVSSAGAWDLPFICVMAIAFSVVMVKVVQPALRRYADRRLDATVLSTTMVGILVCSSVTAAIGVHEIFGAFLLGAVFPRGPLAREVRDRFSSIAVVLLPVFFVTVGLNVDIGAVGIGGIAPFALILLVACAGKLIGAVVGARIMGLRMRESLGLGVLMNTRGLTELVVLSIGRELGVIDDRLFTLLVLMALVTTVATGPLLRVVRPDPWLGTPPPTALDSGGRRAVARPVDMGVMTLPQISCIRRSATCSPHHGAHVRGPGVVPGFVAFPP